MFVYATIRVDAFERESNMGGGEECILVLGVGRGSPLATRDFTKGVCLRINGRREPI